ncbi:MAG TPA: FtsX-like permease family protein [Chitinivibrionales bacterium]|nr:FtsX-like permease family protein [Chitinivibrionales bacterium]
MARPLELFVAMRYLRGKRRMGFISFITWISAGGVFLGSLVLVVALSVANGFEKEVRDRIVGITAHAKILQYYSRPLVNYDSLRTRILKCPGVVAATPYIMEKGGIEYENSKEGVMIMGAEAAAETTVTEVGRKITFGTWALDSAMSSKHRKLPGIVVGVGLADKMGIRPSAEVVVGGLTSEAAEGGITSIPMERFVVRGVFETGMYEYDVGLVYLSIASCQSLFSMKGVEGIAIRTIDLFKADAIGRAVKDSLGGYPYHSLDWKSQNKSLFEWMKLERFVIFIVISLIIVVAAFNIVSSLVMMIIEKRREIGILMGMGATGGSILRIFMFNGVVIGLLGSTLGTALGVAICFVQYHYRFIPIPGDIYFINKLPVMVQWADIAAIYLSANVICFLATLYPAWSASRVLPAESIRIE